MYRKLRDPYAAVLLCFVTDMDQIGGRMWLSVPAFLLRRKNGGFVHGWLTITERDVEGAVPYGKRTDGCLTNNRRDVEGAVPYDKYTDGDWVKSRREGSRTFSSEIPMLCIALRVRLRSPCVILSGA